MTEPISVAGFEARYRADEDPWGYRSRWYERRKYAVTLACLPREGYGTVWEPACSIGVLTRLLAGRADRVLASDASPSAIAAARRDPAPAHVEWSVAELPAPPPCGPGGADLVVLSDILFYLPSAGRARLLADAEAALRPGGDLVAVHWRPRAEDAYAGGAEMHAELCARPGLERLVRHQDEEFLLDVLRR